VWGKVGKRIGSFVELEELAAGSSSKMSGSAMHSMSHDEVRKTWQLQEF
jgi:hypothetical protein